LGHEICEPPLSDMRLLQVLFGRSRMDCGITNGFSVITYSGAQENEGSRGGATSSLCQHHRLLLGRRRKPDGERR